MYSISSISITASSSTSLKKCPILIIICIKKIIRNVGKKTFAQITILFTYTAKRTHTHTTHGRHTNDDARKIIYV